MRGRQSKEKLHIASGLLSLGLMMLFSLSIAIQLFSALDCPIHYSRLILVHLSMLLIWAVVLYSRRSRMLVLLTSVILATASLLWMAVTGYLTIWITETARSLEQYGTWLWLYLLGDRRLDDPNLPSTMLGISAIITFFTALFTLTKPSWLAPAVIGIGCIGTLAVLGHEPYWPGIVGYLLSIICYGALTSYKSDNPMQKVPPDSALLLSVLPMALLAVFIGVTLANRMPLVPANAYDLRSKLQDEDSLAQLEDRQVGAVFGGGKLGGNIVLNDTNVIDVVAPSGGFYLRGTSWDRYTGAGWEHSTTDAREVPAEVEVPEDTLETRTFAPLLAGDSNLLEGAFKPMTIQVIYQTFSANYLYAPLKSDMILDADTPGTMRLDLDGTFISGPVSGPDYSYTAQFDRENTGSDDFLQLARKSSPGWTAGYIASLRQNAHRAELERIQNQSSQMIKRYLQLPDSLPERVGELAEEITQDKATTYDKAQAIETYLRGHYRYTHSPGRPSETDFVDDFLFRNKQGYCTYFATAMTVMMRTLDIPARYVEGYMLPPVESDGITYHVTNRQCHTWVEVYFDGIGWLTFDPTGDIITRQDSTDGTATPSPTPTATRTPVSSPTATPSATDQTVETGDTQPETGADMATVLRYLLLFLLLATVCILAGLVRVYHCRRRLLSMDSREAVLFLYEKILRILASMGYHLQEGETSQVFAVRVDESLGLRSMFHYATGIFEMARFSDHDISREQREILVDFHAKLLSEGRKRLGIFRYILHRYLL